jgi:hypothetical protein
MVMSKIKNSLSKDLLRDQVDLLAVVMHALTLIADEARLSIVPSSSNMVAFTSCPDYFGYAAGSSSIV